MRRISFFTLLMGTTLIWTPHASATVPCCSGFTYSSGETTCRVPGCDLLPVPPGTGDPATGHLISGCFDLVIAASIDAEVCAGGTFLDGPERELIDGCVCIRNGDTIGCYANDGQGNIRAASPNDCAKAAAKECNEGASDSCGNAINDTDGV
jgi:hypothetical protein